MSDKKKNTEWRPDTGLELLSDIYTPAVPDNKDYDHITKDIVLSQLTKFKYVSYLMAEQSLIGLIKDLGPKFSENLSLEKQKISMFVNSMRGFEGFERKQQTTSVNIQKIQMPKDFKEKVGSMLGGNKQGDAKW